MSSPKTKFSLLIFGQQMTLAINRKLASLILQVVIPTQRLDIYLKALDVQLSILYFTGCLRFIWLERYIIIVTMWGNKLNLQIFEDMRTKIWNLGSLYRIMFRAVIVTLLIKHNFYVSFHSSQCYFQFSLNHSNIKVHIRLDWHNR